MPAPTEPSSRPADPTMTPANGAAIYETVRTGQKSTVDGSGEGGALGKESAHTRSLQDLMVHAPQGPAQKMSL